MKDHALNKRASVRCPNCKVVQFAALCVRCRQPLTCKPKYLPVTFTPCSEADGSHDPIEFRIGCAIRRMRQAKHLSQQQLARRMKTSRAQISKLERALVSTSISFLERLTRAFGMEIREFFQRI